MNKLKIIPGEQVLYQGGVFFIKRILDLKNLLLEPIKKNGSFVRAEIKDISPVTEAESESTRSIAIESVPEEDWEIAQKRYAIIRPILAGELNSTQIQYLAAENHIHVSTIYRWIQRYHQTGNTSSLVPSPKNGGRGRSRLNEDIESIVNSVIEQTYLNRQRKSIQRTVKEIEEHCRNNKLKPPHPNTIRNRIRCLSDELKIKQRYGLKAAKLEFYPKTGKYSEASFPLSVVQIDHTKVDIILVDEKFRHPIGRPWITLAIDVFSRMVAGFYISFDPPGAIGTGMCIANAILPKELLLAKHDIAGDWPCWGVMKTIHADNAKEFRGNMLKKASEEYGINLEWRPVKQPNWGGHIERLLGTLLKEVHDLPGTTFSNPTERNNYNSEKNASLTLKEFENWLTSFIVNIYHNRFHQGIGTTPLAKYNEGIFGSVMQVGCGLPERIYDERKLRLDFLPYVERTVQDYGIQIDHIQYYHDVLRKWINSIEMGSGKSRTRRKFIFKRDPRDISSVYFLDPDLHEYFIIPYRNTSHPPITIWEYREAERYLTELGKKHIDENAIFEGYKKIREIESQAVEKTKKVHRLRKLNRREFAMTNSVSTLNDNKISGNETIDNVVLMDIKPFDDLEISNEL
ncbi:Mu transposase C-terminal domain-containing protein [Paludibacter sp.]|uniref:Mu transposase C-terminal domain-containing protein n=1 Tax=Paludibacter sp. TaxID=1898105 RepID=UPI0025F36408|nr:Mu transposase C-terminal domain-containing protein [Paludibacter sp.]